MGNDLTRLLNLSDRLAQQRGDQFIASELFVLAAVDDKGEAGQALKAAGATKAGLEQAIAQMRGGERVQDANAELSIVVCRHGHSGCTRVPVASGVHHFSTLATARGLLVAYAGDEQAQVRTRTFDLDPGRLGPELVPAACWGKSGLCVRPTLARLGRRIVLVAPEKTDLLALESSDEGQHWRAPPVL